MSLVEEHPDRTVPIVKTVASQSKGIEELADEIEHHYEYLKSSGELDRRNRERVRIRMENHLKEKFLGRLIGGTIPVDEWNALLDDVLQKRNNPHDATEEILGRVGV